MLFLYLIDIIDYAHYVTLVSSCFSSSINKDYIYYFIFSYNITSSFIIHCIENQAIQIVNIYNIY